MTPTPTQAAILAAALQHPHQLVAPPARLAPAPRDAIRKSLLAKGLIEPAALEAQDGSTAWPVAGTPVQYRLTGAGLRVVTEPAPRTDMPSGVTQLPVKADVPPQAPAAYRLPGPPRRPPPGPQGPSHRGQAARASASSPRPS
jgi:hypothetical protein